MGVHILEGTDYQASFYCSTSGWAFGPIMGSLAEAEAFLRFLPCDARQLPEADLRMHYAEFRRTTVCECGEVRVTTCTWCNNRLYPAAVNGQHTNDYDWTDTAECELQPGPLDGERWVCDDCRRNQERNPRR